MKLGVELEFEFELEFAFVFEKPFPRTRVSKVIFS